MPIYEFKCLKCEAFFEILVMNQDENVAMKCPECDSEDFERVISTTSHTINPSPSSGQTGATSQTRTCSSGSCTTYTIPGPNG